MPKKIASEKIETALSFDDVLLVPQKSEVLPKNVSLKSKVTQKIELNIPILSSAMDTVTEAKLAIKMAQVGALGVIHRNMSIESQAKEVRKVKKSESGVVKDPITMLPDQTVQEAIEMMRAKNISGCLLYTSPSPRDRTRSRMPSSA